MERLARSGHREELGALRRSAAAGRVAVAEAGAGHGAAHRQFSEADLSGAAALELERLYEISPSWPLACACRPPVRVARPTRRLGRIPPLPAAPLQFREGGPAPVRGLRMLSA